MEKVSLSNKVFTDNPLLDELVYNARQLATGTVLKDSQKADYNETTESIKNGDVLIAIDRGTIAFGDFYYDDTILRSYYGEVPEIYEYAIDNKLIPKADRPALLKKAVDLFTTNFVEYNNYYRMLHGDPPINSIEDYEGLWIDATYIDESVATDISHVSPFYIEEKDVKGNIISDYQLIHKLTRTEISYLQDNGTISNILSDVDTVNGWGLSMDDVRYINFLNDKSIDYINARTAEKFSLLYCPTSDSEEVKKRYKDLLEANRLYMLYTIYSDAYKYRSDYYDNFMMAFLVIQTIIDLIIELPEYIMRKDIFDTRTCKYIFEANGVTYFKTIPLRYQISLVKNLNKIIKFKSTDKCLIDIISLFGFNGNIQGFRYYILRDRNVKSLTEYDEKGNQKLEYYNNTKTVTSESGVESVVPDNDVNYDLKFIKVPLKGKYDDYIRTDANIYDYDEICGDDAYWIGDKKYADVKSAIKDLDFNVLRSKYYTIEAVVDLTQRNFTIVYFMNMLMYNDIDTTSLKISIPTVSTKSKCTLVNSILALYSLGYIYYGIEDTIIDSRAKAAQILGFNLDADLATIAQYLKDNYGGLTMDEMFNDPGTLKDYRKSFQVPNDGKILSFDELQEIYLTNKDIYNHVRKVMLDPPGKEVYNAYRYLYKALFIMNRNMEYFLVGDNTTVDHYKELGYSNYFFNIPRADHYTNPDDYERDYKWFLAKLNEETLYFEMSDDFDTDHNFNLYIFDGTDIVNLNSTAHMAYTYREFLRYADTNLYNFLTDIYNIKNVESRQEACVNAIQNIVGYMKDYIDQDGDDAIYLDEVFSGLPSISLEFVVKYVETVIDFFKSFKIFTHHSPVTYLFDDKFEQYIQLIDRVWFNYLFDKSEYVKIEDYIAGSISKVSPEDKYKILDKVWLDISTWVQKNYDQYYNSTNYEQTEERIKDLMSHISTLLLEDKVMNGVEIEGYEELVVDLILKLLVTLTLEDKVINSDTITSLNETRDLDDYYREWLTDLMPFYVDLVYEDGEIESTKYYCPYCGKEVESTTSICPSCGKIIYTPITKIHYKTSFKDTAINESLLTPEDPTHIYEDIFNDLTINYTEDSSMSDDLHTVITQEFPAHIFDS